jgi:hypothetical protein
MVVQKQVVGTPQRVESYRLAQVGEITNLLVAKAKLRLDLQAKLDHFHLVDWLVLYRKTTTAGTLA